MRTNGNFNFNSKENLLQVFLSSNIGNKVSWECCLIAGYQILIRRLFSWSVSRITSYFDYGPFSKVANWKVCCLLLHLVFKTNYFHSKAIRFPSRGGRERKLGFYRLRFHRSLEVSNFFFTFIINSLKEVDEWNVMC